MLKRLMFVFILMLLPSMLAAESIENLIRNGNFKTSYLEIKQLAKSRGKDIFLLFYEPKQANNEMFEKEVLVVRHLTERVSDSDFVLGALNNEFNLDNYEVARLANKLKVKNMPTVVLLDGSNEKPYGRIEYTGKKEAFWEAFDTARKNKASIMTAWKAVEKRSRMFLTIAVISGIAAMILIGAAMLYVFLDGEISFLILIAAMMVDMPLRIFVPYGVWISGIGWMIFLVWKKGFMSFIIFTLLTGSLAYGFAKLYATGFVDIISRLCPPPL